MNNLKLHYYNEIIPQLIKNFKILNKHKIPKLEKIQINMGLGISGEIPKLLSNAINDISIITTQYPKITKTKKAISNFKIKKNTPIGLVTTLRDKKMYTFLEKLIFLVFPRIRDFNGFSINQFDLNGNYNFGIKEQFLFPEINYESIDKIRGFNINIVTSTNNINESLFLLKAFNFPFKKIE